MLDQQAIHWSVLEGRSFGRKKTREGFAVCNMLRVDNTGGVRPASKTCQKCPNNRSAGVLSAPKSILMTFGERKISSRLNGNENKQNPFPCAQVSANDAITAFLRYQLLIGKTDQWLSVCVS